MLITVNVPGTFYLEDVAVFKTVSQTKYTPTTHEKVLPTFTNVENMSQYGATVQSSPSAYSWGSSGGYSTQQINKGDYIQFEIGSDALTNYYRPAVGISYTPSGKDMGMDYNWYFSGSSGEYQIYTAGGSRTRYITPYTLQNGNRYKIWRNNGNVEFYINDVLNRSFQDMYPDRPMYLEIAFGESNKKVENLYIYKEVVKTSNVVETTHLVAKGDYRYGFNGMERDDQVNGRGNSYTAEFWQYSNRLGRRWNIDPLMAQAPNWSPYRAFFNNPIIYVDIDGLFETKTEARQYKKDHKIEAKVIETESGFMLRNKWTRETWQKGTQDDIDLGITDKDGIINAVLITPKKKSGTLDGLRDWWDNSDFYFNAGVEVTAGAQVGGGVEVFNVKAKATANVASVKLYEWSLKQEKSDYEPIEQSNYYLGKEGVYTVNQGIEIPLLGYEHSFDTKGYGHIDGTEKHKVNVGPVNVSNKKDIEIKFGLKAAFILGGEVHFEFGRKQRKKNK